MARLEVNSGPAAARNKGLAVALAHGAGLVAFINDDALPTPGWLAAMQQVAPPPAGHPCARCSVR